MDEPVKKFDELFYDFLRKSQPLAFLASFSMIIAVFAHSNKDIPTPVYNDAATASMMFIISFITSMLSQLAHENDVRNKEPFSPAASEALRYGTYFFFGIGVIYLLFIANEFGKSSLPIPQIVFGWFKLFVSITMIVLMRLVVVKYRENKEKPFIVGVLIAMLAIISIPTFLLGMTDVFGAFINFHIDENIQHYLNMVAIVPIIPLFLVVLIWRKKKKV